jgi:hypothetical protein
MRNAHGIVMNTKTKFFTFLESICDEPALCDAIKNGYNACMEATVNQLGHNVWQFDSDEEKLFYSPELAKKYFNVEELIYEHDLDVTDDDIEISIRGSAVVIDGKLEQVNDLTLTLWIGDDDMGSINVSIPEVMIPSKNKGDQHTMLATSVETLIEELVMSHKYL